MRQPWKRGGLASNESCSVSAPRLPFIDMAWKTHTRAARTMVLYRKEPVLAAKRNKGAGSA